MSGGEEDFFTDRTESSQKCRSAGVRLLKGKPGNKIGQKIHCHHTQSYSWTKKYTLNNLRVIGLNRVLDHRRPRIQRLSWSILILLSFFFLIYHLTERLVYYGDAPVIADMNIREMKHIPFPAVTVCHYLNGLFAWQNYIKSKLSSQEYEIFKSLRKNKPKLTTLTSSYLNLSNFATNHTFWVNFFQKIWLPTNLSSCKWVSDPITRTVESCSELWVPMAISDLFKSRIMFGCHTMLNNWTAGIESFLRLELQILKVAGAKSAFRITVHDPNDAPQLRENNVKVYSHASAPFTKWDIRFKMTELKLTKSRCQDGGLKHYTGKYSQVKCMLDQIMENSLAECNCHVPWEFGQIAQHQPICHPSKWEICFSNAWKRYHHPEKHSTDDQQHQCVSGCNKKMFDFSTSFYEIKNLKLNDSSNATKEAAADIQTIRIYLKYISTHYLSIEQKEVFGILRLLSEVGGALGLFLGIRILTLAELFDVTLVLCWRKLFSTSPENPTQKKDRQPDAKGQNGVFFKPIESRSFDERYSTIHQKAKSRYMYLRRRKMINRRTKSPALNSNSTKRTILLPSDTDAEEVTFV